MDHLNLGSRLRLDTPEATEEEKEEQRHPKNFHLVLCSATNPNEDTWFFDFIELGTFCGTSTATTPMAYTKQQYETHPPFYTHVGEADILQYLLDWVGRKSKEAGPGDAVSIWIICRKGSEGLQIGNKSLLPQTLTAASKESKEGIKVNMAFSDCPSRFFADDFKKSGRTFKYVQREDAGYFRASDTAATQRRRGASFIQAMVDSISGQVSDSSETTDLRFFGEGDDLINITQYVLFRDFKDMTYNAKAVSRRGGTEWPVLEDPVIKHIPKIEGYEAPPKSRKAAVGLIKKLFQPFIETKTEPHNCDWEFEACATNPSWRAECEDVNCAILALYVRGRMQSAIWDVVHSLVVDGLLDLRKSFAHDVHFNCDHPALSLAAYFDCFEAAVALGFGKVFSTRLGKNEKLAQTISQHFYYFDNHVLGWLGVVVLRGMTVPPAEILAYISKTEWLGGIDDEDFESIKRSYGKYMVQESLPDFGKDGCKMDVCGIFLPRKSVAHLGDLGNRELLRKLSIQVEKSFNNLEAFSKKYFGWGDDIVTVLKEDHWIASLSKEDSMRPNSDWAKIMADGDEEAAGKFEQEEY
ncbi:hypothetical protein TWF481_006967 [Arthrobotrys musiformis]|uniref:Uncharacterized protein n=1 Tax=Arthrobotrys musiformis TaxID=47236 RepID=A0AAV9WBY6_9PEZI